uniref:Uncharacterized protein n=1 Tax=Parascaris equorum TaxID=6256 RepID=A0A914S3Z6_PAREQ
LIPIDASFSLEGCGKEKSCWFHPQGCAANNIQKCSSSVQWTVLKDGVLVQMEASLVGLDPNKAHYVALGISKDMRMVIFLIPLFAYLSSVNNFSARDIKTHIPVFLRHA